MSDNYTSLVWKTSTKTGFGIKGNKVVAWVCEAKATDRSTPALFIKNVSANCFSAAPTRYNTCFNTLSLTAANEKRVWHEATKLTTDTGTAAALQKMVDALADANK